MCEEFKKEDIDILKVYYCPHAPEEKCECRKPGIGMILQSLNDFNIDLENSWLIGDKVTDVETAINAKIRNRILISTDIKENKEYLVTRSLFATINIIKN